MKVLFKLNITVLFFCVLAFVNNDIVGQSKKKLKEEIQHKQEEIENANNLLKETKKHKQSSLYRLNILQKRVTLRNELISQLNQQVNNLETKISDHKKQINRLENKVEKLKKNYEKFSSPKVVL